MGVLYIGNDNVIEVQNLRNNLRNEWVTTADVYVTLKDDQNAEVSGLAWPLVMPFIPGSKGVYRATLPGSLALLPGRTYRAQITANAGAGLAAVWEKVFTAITRFSHD